MPSIVKLCSADARAWAQNQPVWIDDAGAIVRNVTREEQHAISRALARSARVQQSFQQTLNLLSLNPNGRTTRSGQKNIRRMEVAFEIGFVGKQRVVNVYHGEHRYMTGREMLSARLLADHGECVLHGRGGKCIAVLRDPYLTQRPPSTAKRVQYSRNPEEERQKTREPRQSAPSLRSRERMPPKRQAAALVKSPQNCPNDCRGLRGSPPWALAKGTPPPGEREHHPVCKFARAWAETLVPEAERFVLYDLELGRVTRSAEPSEVELARQAEARTGTLQIELGHRVYAVLPADEASQAQAEARGEEPDSALPDRKPLAELAPSPDYALTRAADPEADGSTNVDEESSELGEASSLDDADAELSIDGGSAAGGSTAQQRSRWPTLSQITAQRDPEEFRENAELTARDYLTRQPLSSSPES